MGNELEQVLSCPKGDLTNDASFRKFENLSFENLLVAHTETGVCPLWFSVCVAQQSIHMTAETSSSFHKICAPALFCLLPQQAERETPVFCRALK